MHGGVGAMGDEALSSPFCCSLDDLHFVGNQCSLLLTRVRSLFDANIVISRLGSGTLWKKQRLPVGVSQSDLLVFGLMTRKALLKLYFKHITF